MIDYFRKHKAMLVLSIVPLLIVLSIRLILASFGTSRFSLCWLFSSCCLYGFVFLWSSGFLRRLFRFGNQTKLLQWIS